MNTLETILLEIDRATDCPSSAQAIQHALKAARLCVSDPPSPGLIAAAALRKGCAMAQELMRDADVLVAAGKQALAAEKRDLAEDVLAHALDRAASLLGREPVTPPAPVAPPA